MLDKLESIYMKFENIGQQLSDPKVVADQKRFSQLSKEYKDLQKIADKYKEYRQLLHDIDGAKKMLQTEKDEDFRDMAKDDLAQLEPAKEALEEEIRLMLIPKDPEDDKNAILEIRAGTGGDEASIFAGDLFRMYSKYCAEKGWKLDVMNENDGTAGGYKEVVAEITGEGVYGVLKYESGVHRVQRVPDTETQGRVHTSAATVAILPEADDDVEIEIRDTDIKRDTFRSSGAGGQHVNKTESAVRLTHIPSGIVVECQQERSQFKNHDKAMKMLKSKLYEIELQKQFDAVAAKRKTLVSTGDRSAKIRTYNYPQGRVTDHRIGLTLYNLGEIMNGDLEEIIHSLQIAENAEKLKAETSV